MMPYDVLQSENALLRIENKRLRYEASQLRRHLHMVETEAAAEAPFGEYGVPERTDNLRLNRLTSGGMCEIILVGE
jgi:hypothetical protein